MKYKQVNGDRDEIVKKKLRCCRNCSILDSDALEREERNEGEDADTGRTFGVAPCLSLHPVTM